MIRVIVADDHAVVRHGVRQLLETAPCSDAAGRWGERCASCGDAPAPGLDRSDVYQNHEPRHPAVIEVHLRVAESLPHCFSRSIM